MRVVALVPGGIGDQILFFPTLDGLKRHYPHAQIDVVVEPQSKAAYGVSKSVHEVLTFDYKDRNSLADWGNLVGTIRDREYDVAISAGQSWFVGLLLWLTGIPKRIGYQGNGTLFLTDSIPCQISQYAAAIYYDLLKPLGIDKPCPELAINIPKSALDWAKQEQQRLGTEQTGYILIYAGSDRLPPAQIYPQQSWQEIIQECQKQQPDLPIVVIQDRDDVEFVRSLQADCPNIKITAPEDISKLAAIIGGASLMLSINSPALQLSVAVQTYTIALLGGADPRQLLPKSDKFLTIKSATAQTADISPKTVLEKIWAG
ncbi:glycosyltransferase family 9 protein [Richelia sinica]|uniref:glycosyltransferase family 9 protein n=1 Tax=Richelia sinica TaxID=1357545 RepID=UPI001683BE04|nr:glycosyltransferase family 9 protein [Richelia sinica]MBD2663139.1 glycosyltransferase family 9 protein [Richelia sinica FACHB-800]